MPLLTSCSNAVVLPEPVGPTIMIVPGCLNFQRDSLCAHVAELAVGVVKFVIRRLEQSSESWCRLRFAFRENEVDDVHLEHFILI